MWRGACKHFPCPSYFSNCCEVALNILSCACGFRKVFNLDDDRTYAKPVDNPKLEHLEEN